MQEIQKVEDNNALSMSELIVRTAIRTVYWIVTVAALLCALFTSIFPYQLGIYYYRAGLTRSAFQALERNYIRLGQPDDLTLVNQLAELSIEIFSEGYSANVPDLFYADKLIDYTSKYLSLDSNINYSNNLNDTNVQRAVTASERAAVANHRDYMSTNLVRGYISFGRNQDNSYVFDQLITQNIQFYFYDFEYNVNRLLPLERLDYRILPSWTVGAYLDDAFMQMKMEMPEIIPHPIDDIRVDTYEAFRFSKLYSDGVYTQLYNTVKSVYKLVDASMQQAKLYPQNETRTFMGLLYARWIRRISVDMYYFNAIMLSQNRENFLSPSTRTLITAERTYWKTIASAAFSEYDYLEKAYSNLLTAQ